MGIKVSIVIPSYNSAQFIVETLESVFAQTYRDYEIIIVDDGSTDNTKEILEPYMSKIRYLYKENGGPASARNIGIKNAIGEYIAFLDSDDIWFTEKLEKQMEYFKFNPDFGLVYSDCIRFTEEGVYEKSNNNRQFPSGYIFFELLYENFIPNSTVMTKKECFMKVGYFDEREILKSSEDADMWLRISKYFKVGYINQTLVKYRVRKGGINLSNINRAYKAAMVVIDKAINSIEDKSFNRKRFLRNRLFKIHHNWGLSHFNTDNYQEARKQFSTIIKYGYLNIRIFLYYFLTFLRPNQIRILRKAKHFIFR